MITARSLGSSEMNGQTGKTIGILSTQFDSAPSLMIALGSKCFSKMVMIRGLGWQSRTGQDEERQAKIDPSLGLIGALGDL